MYVTLCVCISQFVGTLGTHDRNTLGTQCAIVVLQVLQEHIRNTLGTHDEHIRNALGTHEEHIRIALRTHEEHIRNTMHLNGGEVGEGW